MNFRKYIIEFIGTFFLAMTVCLTTFFKVSADIQPLSIGLVVMALVYSMGYVSSAHFNPAVTVAFLLRGKIDVKDAVGYAVAQCAGGSLAALIAFVLISAKPLNAPFNPPLFFAVIPALVAELLGTFALVWIVLNVASSKSLEGNNFYGLAIGAGVAGLAYAFNAVSGSFFNPSVALAQSIAGIIAWNNLWIYLVATLAGGALAAVVFRFLNPEE